MQTFQMENLKERDHLCDLGVNARIILKRILSILVVMVWAGFNWLKTGTSGKGTSGSIKGGEFLDQLSDYQRIKQNPA